MAIPYQTAKFKSANIFTMAILGPTTEFNSRQYFWLYSKPSFTLFSNFQGAIKHCPSRGWIELDASIFSIFLSV